MEGQWVSVEERKQHVFLSTLATVCELDRARFLRTYSWGTSFRQRGNTGFLWGASKAEITITRLWEGKDVAW